MGTTIGVHDADLFSLIVAIIIIAEKSRKIKCVNELHVDSVSIVMKVTEDRHGLR